MGGSLAGSLAIHTVVVGAFLWIALAPGPLVDVRHAPAVTGVVWLQQPGPGGGGGGGGNRSIEPPRKEKLAVPKQNMPDVQPVKLPEDALPAPDYLVPVKSQLDESLVGLNDVGASRGSGIGDGMGKGKGTGIGDGDGPGIGDGTDGGTGDGPRRPGAGIEDPVLKKEVKPEYTAEAMRAKIQGTAKLDCVVRADGTVGQCRVVRSLDSIFGLDQKAINAARQWRFLPARQSGKPVAMWVTIELQFTLR
ncbi:MAG: TonB family protein [Acidobacteria bacterium]|nr:TonB family protein [Acidobacteriota bacterium]